MRIAMLLPGGVERGGQERVIPVFLWLIERLARRHRVTVIALSQYPTACSYPLLGATVYNLGTPPRLPLGWIPHQLRQLWQIEKAQGGFDVIHAFWGGKTGWLAGAYGKWRRIPVSVSFCGGELVGLPDVGYGAQLTLRGRLIVQQVLGWAAYLTTQSRPMVDLIATRGYNAEHLPFGVDEGWFTRPPTTGTGRYSGGRQKRLLHIASLNRVKDQSTLLRAMAVVVKQDARVMLDIVGEDTLNGTIQGLAQTLKLDPYVQFHGFLPHAAVRKLYQRADAFVLTSRHEAGPVAVLEAAACNVPTVGTHVGHIADWDGTAAVAIPVASPTALAEAISTALADNLRRGALARTANAWAAHHSADFTARRFEEIFATLVRRRSL